MTTPFPLSVPPAMERLSDPKVIGPFVSQLFRGCAGQVAISMVEATSGQLVTVLRAGADVAGIVEAIVDADLLSRSGGYVRAVTTVAPDYEVKRGRRGGADASHEWVGVVSDIDIAGPSHALPEGSVRRLPNDAEEALGPLDELRYEPTYVNWTGGGYQAWWLFAQPVSLASRLPAMAGACAVIQSALVGLYAGRGLHLDNVGDLPRLMRPLGATRRKADGVHRVTRVEQFDGGRHEPEALYNWACDSLTHWPAPVEPMRRSTAARSSSKSADQGYGPADWMQDWPTELILRLDPRERWEYLGTVGDHEHWRREGSQSGAHSITRDLRSGVILVASSVVADRLGVDHLSGLTPADFVARARGLTRSELAQVVQDAARRMGAR